MELLYKEETYKVIGAAMEVHRELGCGFLEPVYQEALEIELQMQEIPYQREVDIEISYKGLVLNKYYRADLICFGRVIVELKALSALSTEHESQLLNYLTATGMPIGLLINFGSMSLQHKRMVK
jgi:GxxExxY protein